MPKKKKKRISKRELARRAAAVEADRRYVAGVRFIRWVKQMTAETLAEHRKRTPTAPAQGVDVPESAGPGVSEILPAIENP